MSRRFHRKGLDLESEEGGVHRDQVHVASGESGEEHLHRVEFIVAAEMDGHDFELDPRARAALPMRDKRGIAVSFFGVLRANVFELQQFANFHAVEGDCSFMIFLLWFVWFHKLNYGNRRKASVSSTFG